MRKNLIWYQFFRSVLVKYGLYFYYKKMIITGREKVPKNKPLLLLPNHQNSFMDAFLVVTKVKSITYFLTRAKAFEKPLLGKFLRSINLLPVYRVRDGLSSVTKNNAIFEECIRYLNRNDAILIFPEANHDLKRRIRPLSKGFTRIAFDAEIQSDWEMDLQVIPVGVNYTEHRRSRNIVRVNFGDPIPMGEFKELYEENERAAANELKNQVSTQMKKLVMHVTNLNHYNVHKILLADMEGEPKKIVDAEYVNQQVKKIESIITPEIVEIADSVHSFAEKNELDIKSILGKNKSSWKLIAFFPIYLFSWLNNIIPYQPVRKIITNVIKDHAFDTSIKFLIGLILFPFFWIVVSLILLLIGIPGWYILGYLALSSVTSILFKDANQILREAKQKKRAELVKENDSDLYAEFTNGLQKLNEFRAEIL